MGTAGTTVGSTKAGGAAWPADGSKSTAPATIGWAGMETGPGVTVTVAAGRSAAGILVGNEPASATGGRWVNRMCSGADGTGCDGCLTVCDWVNSVRAGGMTSGRMMDRGAGFKVPIASPVPAVEALLIVAAGGAALLGGEAGCRAGNQFGRMLRPRGGFSPTPLGDWDALTVGACGNGAIWLSTFICGRFGAAGGAGCCWQRLGCGRSAGTSLSLLRPADGTPSLVLTRRQTLEFARDMDGGSARSGICDSRLGPWEAAGVPFKLGPSTALLAAQLGKRAGPDASPGPPAGVCPVSQASVVSPSSHVEKCRLIIPRPPELKPGIRIGST